MPDTTGTEHPAGSADPDASTQSAAAPVRSASVAWPRGVGSDVPLYALLLAGGASSRMGSQPKALLPCAVTSPSSSFDFASTASVCVSPSPSRDSVRLSLPLCLQLARMFRAMGCQRVGIALPRERLRTWMQQGQAPTGGMTTEATDQQTQTQGEVRTPVEQPSPPSLQPLPVPATCLCAIYGQPRDVPPCDGSCYPSLPPSGSAPLSSLLLSLPPGVEFVFDDVAQFSDIGPAAGMLAAHELHPRASWIVCACDFPLLDQDTIAQLLQASNGGRISAAFLHASDGAPEPLLAVWSAAALRVLATNVATGRTGPCYTLRGLMGLALPPKKNKATKREETTTATETAGASSADTRKDTHVLQSHAARTTASSIAAAAVPPAVVRGVCASAHGSSAIAAPAGSDHAAPRAVPQSSGSAVQCVVLSAGENHALALFNTNTPEQWAQAVEWQRERLHKQQSTAAAAPHHGAERLANGAPAIPTAPSSSACCEHVSRTGAGGSAGLHVSDGATSLAAVVASMRSFGDSLRQAAEQQQPCTGAEDGGECETIPLSACLGRVSARQVCCPLTLPRFASSAMDGFVLRAADVAHASPDQPVLLRVRGSIAAGDAPPLCANDEPAAELSPLVQSTDLPLAAACCFEIMTGAPLPVALRPSTAAASGVPHAASTSSYVCSPHFDTVVKVEDVELIYDAPAPASAVLEQSTAHHGQNRVEERARTTFFRPDARVVAIRVRRPISAGSNIRAAGDECAVGDVLLRGGQRLRPAHVLALANAGLREVVVRRRIRIALLSTGSELSADAAPLPNQSSQAGGQAASLSNAPAHAIASPPAPPRATIPDSNTPHVRACLQQAFGDCVDVRVVASGLTDDVATTCRGLRAALRGETALADAVDAAVAGRPAPACAASRPTWRPDLLLSTGGVSVGRHDCVPRACTRLGASVLFHGVAIRPGHPLMVARFEHADDEEVESDATTTQAGRMESTGVVSSVAVAAAAAAVCFVGLPGNPVAASVGLRFVVFAFLRARMGLPIEMPMYARLHLDDDDQAATKGAAARHAPSALPPLATIRTLRMPPSGHVHFVKACLLEPAASVSGDPAGCAPSLPISCTDLRVSPFPPASQQSSRCAPLWHPRFVWLQLEQPTGRTGRGAGRGKEDGAADGVSADGTASLHGSIVPVWLPHGCVD